MEVKEKGRERKWPWLGLTHGRSLTSLLTFMKRQTLAHSHWVTCLRILPSHSTLECDKLSLQFVFQGDSSGFYACLHTYISTYICTNITNKNKWMWHRHRMQPLTDDVCQISALLVVPRSTASAVIVKWKQQQLSCRVVDSQSEAINAAAPSKSRLSIVGCIGHHELPTPATSAQCVRSFAEWVSLAEQLQSGLASVSPGVL